MIIITGLGRCGTSFFISLFKECGFGIGKHLSWNKDVNAGYEFAPAYAISRDMYDDFIKKNREVDLDKKVRCPYWKKEMSLRERILSLDNDTPDYRNEGTIDVIKDPRVTWHPEIIRKWWEVRKDLKLIILHRRPEDIISSREKYGLSGYGSNMKFQDPKRGKDITQFKIDFGEFLTEVLGLEIPYLLLFYPNFMYYEPEMLYSKLYRILGIDMSSKKRNFIDVWKELIDENKITYF